MEKFFKPKPGDKFRILPPIVLPSLPEVLKRFFLKQTEIKQFKSTHKDLSIKFCAEIKQRLN